MMHQGRVKGCCKPNMRMKVHNERQRKRFGCHRRGLECNAADSGNSQQDIQRVDEDGKQEVRDSERE